MSLSKNLALAALVYLFSVTIAMPSATGSKDKKPSKNKALVAIKITAPAAPNTFPPEIMDRMRKKLMVFMGVEPDKTEVTAKSPKQGQ